MEGDKILFSVELLQIIHRQKLDCEKKTRKKGISLEMSKLYINMKL